MADHVERPLVCFRGACTAPAHPCGYNRVTQGLYCLDCARRIEDSRDACLDPFFPLLPRVAEVTEGGSWCAGTVLVREVRRG